jgi:hypothetical protein
LASYAKLIERATAKRAADMVRIPDGGSLRRAPDLF